MSSAITKKRQSFTLQHHQWFQSIIIFNSNLLVVLLEKWKPHCPPIHLRLSLWNIWTLCVDSVLFEGMLLAISPRLYAAKLTVYNPYKGLISRGNPGNNEKERSNAIITFSVTVVTATRYWNRSKEIGVIEGGVHLGITHKNS